MDFYINGEKVEVSIESEKTVGDVLQSFALECENNKAAVIGITVNGNKISADQFDSISTEPLTADSKFEFDIVNECAVSESFATLFEGLKLLADEIEQVPALFINGKISEAGDSIKKLADAIDQFCHIATLASLFPATFGNIMIGGNSISDFFNDFSPILSDFEGALSSNDTVLVGDLCEYEICPRLRDMAQALTKFSV